MSVFRRTIQLLSLGLFFLLLTLAVISFKSPESLDLFLRLDPGLALLSTISARTLAFAFFPALLVMVATLFFGRIFCGYICPMGTTLDGGDKLFGTKRTSGGEHRDFSHLKYLVLCFLLGAALLGVSLVFLAAPLSLITRFYALLIHPVLALISHKFLGFLHPLTEQLDLSAFAFVQVATPKFTTQMFIFIFFGLVFFLARLSPRFWCRNLCPSGALMAVISMKPVMGRRVSEACTACGKCISSCPMAAIPVKSPQGTRHEECIVCRTCEAVCPEQAINFGRAKNVQSLEKAPFSQGRRQFLYSGFLGTAVAVTELTGLHAPADKPGPGQVAPPKLIRPPGTLPESAFLSRCVRCGECMAACPTNTLQPIWFDAGFMGMFSPALTPRRGYCSPECTLCGHVCPTGAIRPLSPQERIWAKTGTAVIYPTRCLAWEQQKSCMVCDEVCPYKAVIFRKEPGNRVPVPRVDENKCAGCGYCEHYCPVQNEAAIVVTPMGSLRLSEGSYLDQGKAQGLRLSIHTAPGAPAPENEGGQPGFAPGFDDASTPGPYSAENSGSTGPKH
jgi:MauM/NapG family ferredoxin protein